MVVVACDLPYLGRHGQELVEALGDHDAAVARSDRAEPLCAVWSSALHRCYGPDFEAGERAVHRAIEGLDVAWVPVPATLRNVNTPDDLGNL